MVVYTVGYGNRGREQFISLMRDNSVGTVVDVRLRPDRASMGIWVKAKTPEKGIERWLCDAGVGYRSLIELGNVFVELEDWRERYGELLRSSGGLLVRRLGAIPGPICLLCAEMKVEECHRQQIADYLAKEWAADICHL